MAIGAEPDIGIVFVESLVGQNFGQALGGGADIVGPHGIVFRAQKRGIGAAARHFAGAAAGEFERQGDVGRHGASRGLARQLALGLHVVDHRTEKRPIARIARIQFGRQVERGHTGQRKSHAVQRIRMRHRAQHRGAVHHLGEGGKQFADPAAWQAGIDRVQFAADFQRGIGLGVDPFDLAGRTVEVDQDDRLGLAKRFGPLDCFRGAEILPVGQIGQAHARQSQRTDSQQVTASHAVAQLSSRPEDP